MNPMFDRLFIRYIFRLPALRAAALSLAGSAVLCLLMSALAWTAGAERQRLADEVARLRRQQVVNVKLENSTRLAAASLPQLEALERMLQRNFSQSEIARQLTELAEKNGLKVDAQTYAEKIPAAGYIAYQQEITLRGSYPALRRYLLELRQSAAWIETGELRVQHARNQPGIVQAILRVVAYKRGSAP
ncbi:MAG TPA: hypothetical protein VFX02_09050 [Gammaproteobacteria bacterium]|nr:hypothetical protein [Gammaproteobacteria bacterium]